MKGISDLQIKASGFIFLISLSLPTFASNLPWNDHREKFAHTHSEKLKEFETLHFSEPSTKELEKNKRSGVRTDSLMIIHDNNLIFEKYARGSTAKTKHITWSVSKSVMSLLYAVAQQENKFSLADSVCKFGTLPNLKLCKINFSQALQWTSGIQWVEEYERSKAPKKASILAMLYGEGHQDMMTFVARQPFAAEPGKVWRYSSGDSILLSHVLAKIYSQQKNA